MIARRLSQWAQIVACVWATTSGTTTYAQRLIWIEHTYELSRIRAVPLDGGLPTDLVVGIPNARGDIALHPGEGRMYWSDDLNAKIQRADFDGTNIEDVIVNVHAPSVAIDAINDKLYWTSNAIRRSNLDGSVVQIVVSGVQGGGLALDVANGSMYWSEFLNDRIRKANLDGSNVQPFLSNLAGPSSLSVDLTGGALYWTEHDGPGSRIRRASLVNPQPVDIVVVTYEITSLGIDPVGMKVYWGAGTIHRADLDGTNVEPIMDFADVPYGLAIDGSAGKIYWTADFSRQICRAGLDGTSREVLLDSILVSPLDVHWDAVTGQLYWADYGARRIGRSSADGLDIEHLLNGSFTSSVATNAYSSRLFLVEAELGAERIQASSFDGSNLVNLVTTDLEGPSSLVTDTNGQGLYWCDLGRNVIERIDFDGSNRVSIRAADCDDLAFDDQGSRLYWIEYSAIYRCDADGTNGELFLNISPSSTRGIAIDQGARKVYWSQSNPPKIRRADVDGSNIEDVPIQGPFVPGRLTIEYSLDVPAMPNTAIAFLALVLVCAGSMIVKLRFRAAGGRRMATETWTAPTRPPCSPARRGSVEDQAPAERADCWTWTSTTTSTPPMRRSSTR